MLRIAPNGETASFAKARSDFVISPRDDSVAISSLPNGSYQEIPGRQDDLSRQGERSEVSVWSSEASVFKSFRLGGRPERLLFCFCPRYRDVPQDESASSLGLMSAARQTMGLRGERVAERWLGVHGWEIAERRFRNGHRDIDLVAIKREGDGRTVAFVEVKTRASADFGGPLSAVDWRKQRELTRSAKVWMSRFQKPGDTFRFDVIGVILGAENVRVQHVENAFLIPSKN
jgi:putative endonuclease